LPIPQDAHGKPAIHYTTILGFQAQRALNLR